MIDKIEIPINIEDLSINYGSKRVLSNIYLELLKGHVIGLIGPNGAGKSTLIKAILGLIEYEVGNIKVFGEDVDDVRKRIAYVPQKDEIDWSFPATVFDVVMMGRYPHIENLASPTKKDKALVIEALEEMDMLAFKDRQIGKLSGGQQQRVFLARAIAQQADLFLLDEPFVGVDSTTEKKIIELMQRQARADKTMLVVHHDLASVSDYFDKVIMLNQRIIAYGNVEEVFNEAYLKKTYGGQLSVLNNVLIDS